MQASRAEPNNEHPYDHLQLLTIRSSPSEDPAGNQIHHEKDERRRQQLTENIAISRHVLSAMIAVLALSFLTMVATLTLTISMMTTGASETKGMAEEIQQLIELSHEIIASKANQTGRENRVFDKATRGLFSYDPAQSCKEIKDLGISNGDGEYWIDPGRTNRSFKAYCDMTTDRGGWLLVSNVVSHGSSRTELPVKTSYREVSSKEMLLTKSAMKELRKHLHFTQIRFYCKKRGGSTFHITTAANSTGEAAVKYLSGETDVMPASCGSFVIMSNDNSRLARVCQDWGYQRGSYKVGKWGAEKDQNRLYDHTAFVVSAYHWILTTSGRWDCDDFNVGVSPGDVWRVFVR